VERSSNESVRKDHAQGYGQSCDFFIAAAGGSTNGGRNGG
jgi:hypothetical protein